MSPVRRPSAVKSWMGVILGATLMLSISACGTGTAPEDPTSSSPAASVSAPPPPAESTASLAPEATAERTGDNDATVCSDTDFGEAATMPELLSDLSIPFYACTHEMEALTGTDPLFVGAYDTNHEMIIVEMAIATQLEDSGWDTLDHSVEGDTAVRKAEKPGYSLVIAIGPERTGAGTSIYYTLREQ